MGLGPKSPWFALIAFGLWCSASVAMASPADTKRACIAASTDGQTERDAGNLLEARKQLLMCAADECPPVVRKSCTGWLADVEERIPSVVVRVLDAQGADMTDATLTIDGEASQLDGRPVSLNPGPHTLVVTEPSGKTTERKVLLAEKETGRLISVQLAGDEATAATGGDASFEAGASTDGPYSSYKGRGNDQGEGFKVPVGAWVLGGVGIAGLASFTAFGLMAKGDLDDLEKTCSPSCSDDDTSSGKNKALIADISLGVGAAALVGAGVWIWVAHAKHKKGDDKRSVSLVPTREGVMAGYRASF